MTTTARPDHRTLPRQPRPISPRDQAIYLAYRTAGKTQAQLAEDNHLSQRRISSILQRVERRLASPTPGQLDHRQSQRLERWLEQQRLQAIYDRSIRGYDAQKSELKTTRKGDRDGKPYHDETTREVPPNVQLLKVALRAAEDLGKLADKPAPAAPEPHDAKQRFWQAHALISELRRGYGLTDHPSGESAYIMDALNALLGKEPAGSAPRTTPTRSVSEGPDADVGWVKDAPASADPRGADDPSSDDWYATTDVGCISEAQCTNDTADDASTSSSNLAPAPTGSNYSNPAPREGAPSESPAAPATTSPEPPSAISPSPSPLLSPSPQETKPSLAERRRLHYEKLKQLHEARRLGLPCLIMFDPEDGPIPPPGRYLDDFGYAPPDVVVPGPS